MRCDEQRWNTRSMLTKSYHWKGTQENTERPAGQAVGTCESPPFLVHGFVRGGGAVRSWQQVSSK
jgi:hypothetical protein